MQAALEAVAETETETDHVVSLETTSSFTRALIDATTASAAEEAFDAVVAVTSSTSPACTVALFTDAAKFADDVERLDSPPTIVVGSLRRITDLVKRGVLQTSALRRLSIPCCEDIASIPSDLERLRTLLQFVDLRSTSIAAACSEDAQQNIHSAVSALAPDWIWMRNI